MSSKSMAPRGTQVRVPDQGGTPQLVLAGSAKVGASPFKRALPFGHHGAAGQLTWAARPRPVPTLVEGGIAYCSRCLARDGGDS